MNQTLYSIQMDDIAQKKLFNAFQEFLVDEHPQYAKWQLKPENCTITCYESGKVVFQGKDAQVYASAFLSKTLDTFPQAGSDEVGTGDYFGPVCVCACIVEEKDQAFLEKLGVRDSKQLTDKDIISIAPKLMKKLTYSLLIVDNKKYNSVHGTTNMNAIKAKLHNQAYINLNKKKTLPKLIVIDQFAPETQYYNYLKNDKIIQRGIHFETKAEDKYPAVGAASVIARYAFLQSMDQMESKYKMSFHKGAGIKTDEDAQKFIDRYGFKRLSEVAKVHFKNTEKIKKES